MIRNVVVINDFAYINGGAGKVAIMSALALADQGINVFFFCGTGPVCEELKNSKVKIVSTNQGDITKGSKIKGLLQGINNKFAEEKLYQLLQQLDKKETIVHCHAWSKILSSSIFKATKKEKGIPIFCEAMKLRGSKGVVIGDGPILDSLAKKYPMVDFVGWKNSDEIDKYAVKAKGLVFPSVWYEAAPLTIPEVMGKYGLPCIVSDACAGQDYIHNGINGYIFKNGDVNDLIDKLNLLDMKSKKLQENILHSFNRNMYSKNTHASNLIKEYNKILEKNVKYL